MQFTSANGRKPSTEARRHVYRIIAKTLVADLANGSSWLWEGMEEPDQRRLRNAVKKVIVEMTRKSES